MALFEHTLFGDEDKVQKAIERLQMFEPPEGYYVAFSGGKDSQCVYHLCEMAGVKFDAHYSVTSVDPPELMRFLKEHYPDVIWERNYWHDDKPEHHYSDGRPKQVTMWNLIADHTIPPTRQARYCCSQLKETGGGGRLVVTGVRWAESARRKNLHGVADIQTSSKKLHAQAAEIQSYKMNKSGGIVFMDDNDDNRKMIEQCYLKNRTTINPIVDWSDEDVWEFLNDVAKVPHCCLYDEGLTRLGCIGCPLQGREGMLADFERWPKYKDLYIRAFDKMIQNHPGDIKVATGEPAEVGGGGAMSSESGYAGQHEYTFDWHGGGGRSTQLVDVDAQKHQGQRRTQPNIQTHMTSPSSTTTGPNSAQSGTSSDGLPILEWGGSKCSTSGSGVSETRTSQRLGLSEKKYHGDGILSVLALEMPERYERLAGAASAWAAEHRDHPEREYNRDPKVADYESGAWLLDNWINNWR